MTMCSGKGDNVPGQEEEDEEGRGEAALHPEEVERVPEKEDGGQELVWGAWLATPDWGRGSGGSEDTEDHTSR